MPVGSQSAFARIINSVLATNPQSILDLGIGYGMNAAGIRNWYSRDCEIVGVEIFNQYENHMWHLYDDVVINDIHQYLTQAVAFDQHFDMVIMSDVIEHFDKDKGKEVIEMIKHIAKKYAIISTPFEFIEQDSVNGNDHERHLSHWTAEDFKGWGVVQNGAPDWLGHKMLIVDYVVK